MVLEPLDDGLVGILYEDAFPVGNFGCELTLLIDRAHCGNSGTLEYLIVLLTEAGRRVDDTSAVLGGDVVAADDDEGTLCLEVGEVREERLVGHALKL